MATEVRHRKGTTAKAGVQGQNATIATVFFNAGGAGGDSPYGPG